MFYIGPGGWTDQQLPDGTIVFTAPDREYRFDALQWFA
jgi:hypothetical protein